MKNNILTKDELREKISAQMGSIATTLRLNEPAYAGETLSIALEGGKRAYLAWVLHTLNRIKTAIKT